MIEEEIDQILNKKPTFKPSLERDNHQPSAYPIEQLNGTQDKEESKEINDKYETSPL